MKTQTLYKRLSIPLLITVISATGIGVSSPARASLIGFQSTAIDTNPEAVLIAGRLPRCKPGQYPPGCDPGHTQGISPTTEPSPSVSPTITPPKIEQPTITRPKIEQPKIEQPKIEQPKIEQPKSGSK